MRTMHRFIVAVVLMVAAKGIYAETVYKSVDEKGNVTYSQKPPTQGGKIRSTKELPIDPNQNVLPIPRLNIPINNSSDQNQSSQSQDDAEAQQELQKAEAELKAGSEVQPGDFAGKAGGGVGPSQQRLQRLEELQREVDRAREKAGQSSGE